MRRHVDRFILGVPYAALGIVVFALIAIAIHVIGGRLLAWAISGVGVVLVIYCVGGLVEAIRER